MSYFKNGGFVPPFDWGSGHEFFFIFFEKLLYIELLFFKFYFFIFSNKIKFEKTKKFFKSNLIKKKKNS
jgi:hypothetical protein